ncbi:hypothetical protein VTO42DRAFT_277 [Malbranchea cinnamomea]
MKSSLVASALCLAGSAFAAPVVQTPDLPTTLPDVPGVKPELLSQLAPCVGQVVVGLGLGDLAPKLTSLATVSVTDIQHTTEKTYNDIKGLDIDIEIEIAGLAHNQILQTVKGLKQIVVSLGLDKLSAGQEPSVDGLAPEARTIIVEAVVNLLAKLSLKSLAPGLLSNISIPALPTDVTEVPGVAPPEVLAELAVDISALITGLGLESVDPVLTAVIAAITQHSGSCVDHAYV